MASSVSLTEDMGISLDILTYKTDDEIAKRSTITIYRVRKIIGQGIGSLSSPSVFLLLHQGRDFSAYDYSDDGF